MNEMSEVEQVKLNMENIKAELGHLVMHKEVLIWLIEDCKKIFESKIVIPRTTRNLTIIGKDDLEIDMVSLKNCNSEQVIARYNFYHYSRELADVGIAIDVKKDLMREYQEHLKQYFAKQARTVSDEDIYDKLQKAQALTNLSPEEKETLQGIIRELPKRMNAGKDSRIEVFEALQNLILQHG
jgi:hypothetical protein